MPLISVIVPIYKVEKYLRQCVNSVLSQTFTDFELILVDDGSPDNCGTICDDYAKMDLRVKVIHQRSQGLSAARNTGIEWVNKNSDSEWIAFLDSDDWMHPGMLENMLKANLQNRTQISVCTFVRADSDTPAIPEFCGRQDVFTPAMLYEKYQYTAFAWNKLYKKELWRDIRYPVGRVYEDSFTTHRILFQVDKISMIWDAYHFYRSTPNSISRAAWSSANIDYLDALLVQIPFFVEHQANVVAQNSANKLLNACLDQIFAIFKESGTINRRTYISEVVKRLAAALRLCIKHKLCVSVLYENLAGRIKYKLRIN